jgi:CxxC motif-containing protein (DUF1111 family)
MSQGPKWKRSFALLMTVAAGTTLLGIEALSADNADAQTRRTHPHRRPPAPTPAPTPSPTPPPGSAAVDPGVRGGTVDAGQMLAPLVTGQGYEVLFDEGADAFADLNSVQGTIPGEADAGLGPRFNSNGCGTCHAQPALGGSSPNAKSFPFLGPNPQVAVATLQGATNRVPFFITADGPVREARFKFAVRNGNLTSTPDGGVHQIFTIQGRSDATNTVGITGSAQTCRLAQPDFDQARRLNNLSFRVPTPVFGLGLIETIPDAAIIANMQANANLKATLGISGRPNRNGNDGTISRFGWKAQNPSLMVFAAEAYNVEQGITNEGFPLERANPGDDALPTECLFNSVSEDHATADTPGDIVLFSAFMRLLAPPTPSSTSPGGAASIQRGAQLFQSVGCALCHTPSLTSAPATFTGAPVEARLYSDLLLHDMGSALADGVSQGAASGSEFRTAPLWGLGQRVFFLHDGRSSDLNETIQWHGGSGSEARGVSNRYFGLSEADKQSVLNFLRSL